MVPLSTAAYPLSLHDALPILPRMLDLADLGSLPTGAFGEVARRQARLYPDLSQARGERSRSEEHTSELQSRGHLVCRLLLEKKKFVTHDKGRNAPAGIASVAA